LIYRSIGYTGRLLLKDFLGNMHPGLGAGDFRGLLYLTGCT
jgi:hypothetical protein